MKFKFLILPFLFLISGINAYPGCSSTFAVSSCKSHFNNKWPLCEAQRKVRERQIMYNSAIDEACSDNFIQSGKFNCEYIFDYDCNDRKYKPANHKDYKKCVEQIKKNLSHNFDRSWNYIEDKYIKIN